MSSFLYKFIFILLSLRIRRPNQETTIVVRDREQIFYIFSSFVQFTILYTRIFCFIFTLFFSFYNIHRP